VTTGTPTPPPATDPIDAIHAMCMEAREIINSKARAYKAEAARWEPRPMPRGWMLGAVR
jgi:hypothetical protein